MSMQTTVIPASKFGGKLEKFADKLNGDEGVSQGDWRDLFAAAQKSGAIPKGEKYEQVNLHICGVHDDGKKLQIIATEVTTADGLDELTDDQMEEVMTGTNAN